MTSPSETPLDLDEVRRNYLPDMRDARGRERNWCECQKGGVDAVSIDGDWLHLAGVRFADAVAEVERLRVVVAGLEDHIQACYRDMAQRPELEARPRTVGNLTARDLGRRVRIDGREMIIDSIMSARDHGVLLGLWPAGLTVESLDTPVEFLDDEPASGHQQPGERFPSHETSEGAQVDPDADERGNASAFRSSKEES